MRHVINTRTKNSHLNLSDVWRLFLTKNSAQRAYNILEGNACLFSSPAVFIQTTICKLIPWLNSRHHKRSGHISRTTRVTPRGWRGGGATVSVLSRVNDPRAVLTTSNWGLVRGVASRLGKPVSRRVVSLPRHVHQTPATSKRVLVAPGCELEPTLCSWALQTKCFIQKITISIVPPHTFFLVMGSMTARIRIIH